MFGFLLKVKQLSRRLRNSMIRTDSIDITQMRRSLLDIAVEEYRMRAVLLNIRYIRQAID